MIDQNPTQHDKINPVGLSQLVNGRFVNLFELGVDDIQIQHIAHSLSRLCRYNGHVEGFITVAGHSIRCAQRAIETDRRDVALECLIHDAAEAYIGDLVRPLKNHPDFKEKYLALEERIEVVIAEALGTNFPFDPYVKEMDIEDSVAEMAHDRFDPDRWDDIVHTERRFLRLFAKLKAERL